MKAIIFGANGQDGFYLSDLLRKKGIEVIGVSRSGDFLRTNIADFNEVAALVKSSRPDFIFHLAANSTTNHSALIENHNTIVTGSLSILEAVKSFSPATKVFISGSGLQFENRNAPIKETDNFEARDAYSLSRIQSVYAARYYRRLGVRAYVGYLFNHDSPRRSERHIAKKITSFVRNLKNGTKGMLEIGDPSTIKEWAFAGDIVEGIWTLINQDKLFEANVSSGVGYSIMDWVECCFDEIGEKPDGYIQLMPGFTAEYDRLVSDPAIIRQLGFTPKTSLQELAKMMVHDE